MKAIVKRKMVAACVAALVMAAATSAEAGKLADKAPDLRTLVAATTTAEGGCELTAGAAEVQMACIGDLDYDRQVESAIRGIGQAAFPAGLKTRVWSPGYRDQIRGDLTGARARTVSFANSSSVADVRDAAGVIGLKAEIMSRDEQIKAAGGAVEALKLELSKSEAAARDLRASLDALEKKDRALQMEHDRAAAEQRAQQDLLTKQLQDAQQAVSASQTRIGTLSAQADGSGQKVQDLSVALEAAKADLQSARVQIATYESTIKNLQAASVVSATEAGNRARAENAEAVATARAEASKAVEDAQRDRAARGGLEAAQQDLQKQVAALKRDLQSAQGQAAQASFDLDKALKANETLRSQQAKITEDERVLADHLRSGSRERDELKAQIASLQNEASRLNMVIADKDRQIVAANESVNALRSGQTTAIKAEVNANAQAVSVQAQRDDLAHQLQAAQAQHQADRDEIGRLEGKLAATNTQQAALADQTQKAASDQAGLTVKLAAANAERDAMAAQVRDMAARLTKLQATYAADKTPATTVVAASAPPSPDVVVGSVDRVPPAIKVAIPSDSGVVSIDTLSDSKSMYLSSIGIWADQPYSDPAYRKLGTSVFVRPFHNARGELRFATFVGPFKTPGAYLEFASRAASAGVKSGAMVTVSDALQAQ